MVKRRIIKNIKDSVPSNGTYENIKSQLNFDGFNEESPSTLRRVNLFKIAIPVSALFVLSITLSTIIAINYSQNERDKSSHFNLLHKTYIETNIESEEASLKHDEVIKFNTYDDFAYYIDNLSFASITDFNDDVNERLFKSECVFSISFLCCASELDPSVDGKGPTIDKVHVINNVLDVNISIPQIGHEEDMNREIFFVSCSKNIINDDFKYTFDITQRNTGEKGSSYYKNVY